MNKYTDLIQMLEKIFGKGSVSRTIGTRTNVVRFPKGKQPIDPTRGEFDVEGTAVKNPDLVQTIENSIEDRMGDITKMNDQELLTYTSNVRRLLNFKEPPIQNADVVKFGSGEEIKGEGLEQLIQKQGTKNPPTTVAGRLEAQGKKLEKAGEDLKKITEPKSVIGDIIKDYGDFDKYMQSSQKTGYVRATVRQIMREDIQAGKLKLPKELQDQVMQGIGEPIDIYRKVYGEGALEQIDSLADDLGQFRTEEEAAKFARSKYQMEPKLEPVDESMTYDELGNLIKKGPDEPEGKADGGIIGYANNRSNYFIGGFIRPLIAKIKGIVSPVQPTPPAPEIPLTLLERYQKYLSQSTPGTGDEFYNQYKKNLEQKADGGRIGYAKGKRVKSSIDKLIDQLNKKTQGKKSMESVNPKTGEVTVPKKPIKRAEEPTGVTVMDPEPDIIDERSIKKTKSRQLTREEIEDYSEQLGDTETWLSEGTVEEAEKALKRMKDQEAYYYGQYKMGKLDPVAGEKSESRMKFLRKKAEEAQITGDRRLITSDEMDELSDLESTYLNDVDEAYGMDTAVKKEMKQAMKEGVQKTNRMIELGLDPSSSKDYDKFLEMELIKQKYGNVIDDNLLQQILVDDNPQRKAEVLASIDEAIKMQERGIGPEQILDIIKNTTRTKQAKGGIAGLI
jgi:soluble cytochrome b562